MTMVLMIIEGTLEQCARDGYRVSVVVVAKAGNVAASLRGDGTNPHTMEFGVCGPHARPNIARIQNLTDKPENAYLRQIPTIVALVAAYQSRSATKCSVASASPVLPVARKTRSAPMPAAPKELAALSEGLTAALTSPSRPPILPTGRPPCLAFHGAK
jgi:hypothetical protein